MYKQHRFILAWLNIFNKRIDRLQNSILLTFRLLFPLLFPLKMPIPLRFYNQVLFPLHNHVQFQLLKNYATRISTFSVVLLITNPLPPELNGIPNLLVRWNSRRFADCIKTQSPLCSRSMNGEGNGCCWGFDKILLKNGMCQPLCIFFRKATLLLFL